MGENERQKALQRLIEAAAKIQSPEELNRLARATELRAEWEDFVAKAQALAARSHSRRKDTSLVAYDDVLQFGQSTGLRQQRISRFWTALFKSGTYMHPGDMDVYQASELTLAELKHRLEHKKLSNEDRLILQLWLKVL